MYVALKELRVSVPGEGRPKVVVIGAGEPVPGAEDWQPATLMANVNLGNLQYVPENMGTKTGGSKRSRAKTGVTASKGG